MDKLNGYLEIELGGETRVLKFGMGAWIIISDERKLPLDRMFSDLNEFSFIAWITYAAVKFAALSGYTEQKPPTNVYVVMDWLNSANPETFREIGRIFAESKNLGETMKKYIETLSEKEKQIGGNKKKATSRKSSTLRSGNSG